LLLRQARTMQIYPLERSAPEAKTEKPRRQSRYAHRTRPSWL